VSCTVPQEKFASNTQKVILNKLLQYSESLVSGSQMMPTTYKAVRVVWLWMNVPPIVCGGVS
jgi:hypothetical protein